MYDCEVIRVKIYFDLCSVKVQDKCFIARQRINSVSNVNNDKNIIEYKNSYYDIRNGHCIVSLSFFSSLEKETDFILDAEGEIKVFPLSKILNLKNNKKYYLDQEEINLLVNFEKENKVYKKSR